MNMFLVGLNEIASIWGAYMVAVLWQSAVLAVCIFCILACMRRVSSSVRFALWMLVPLRLLLAPFPDIVLPVLPAAVETGGYTDSFELDAEMTGAFSGGVGGGAEQAAPSPPIQSLVTVAPVQPTIWPTFQAGLLLFWCLGLAVCAGRFVLAWRKARRIVESAREGSDPRLCRAGVRAQALLELREGPRLVVTREDTAPFVMGFRAKEYVVVLPESLLKSLSDGQLLAVLSHEFAHIRRGDGIWGMVLCLSEIVYFFNPVLHWAKRGALLEREKASDEWVLARSRTAPASYAHAIAAAAGHMPSLKPQQQPAALLAESFGELKQRLASLAQNLPPKAGLSTTGLLLLVLLAALTTPGFILAERAGAAQSEEGFVISTSTGGMAGGGMRTRGVDALPGPAAKEAPHEVVVVEPIDLPKDDGFVPEGPLPDAPVSMEERVLQFPEDRSLGVVQIRDPKRRILMTNFLGTGEPWNYHAQAQGTVRIPAGKEACLKLRSDTQGYWRALRKLQPDGFYMVTISGRLSNNPPLKRAAMEDLTALKGLRELNLHTCEAESSDVLALLSEFEQLEHLKLSKNISNKDLEQISKLGQVKGLTMPGSSKCNAMGMRHLGRMKQLEGLYINGEDNLTDASLAFVESLPRLKYFGIAGKKFGDFGMQYVSKVATLRILQLKRVQISNTGLESISRLSNLERLGLSGNYKITDSALGYLKRLPHLRGLGLSSTGGSRLTDAGMVHVAACKNLERLSLSGNIGEEGMQHIANLKKLTYLWISTNSKSPLDDGGLALISTLPNLEELHVGGGEISDAGVAHLAKLSKLRQLNVISDSRMITNEGMRHIGSIQGLETLVLRFGMRDPIITTAGLNEINRLKNLRYFRFYKCLKDEKLDVSGLSQLEHFFAIIEGMSDEDVACFSKLTQLEWLDGLSGVSDKGMAHVASLTNLGTLGIQKSPQLTDQGLRHLAGMQKMSVLNLNEISFDGSGAQYLSKLQGLRSLRLHSDRSVSKSVEKGLVDALPNLDYLNGQPL
jgi:beta-lactamase regulating signal transducer with metallopeptidase domain/Leucine-rich repeat (LRR) protein